MSFTTMRWTSSAAAQKMQPRLCLLFILGHDTSLQDRKTLDQSALFLTPGKMLSKNCIGERPSGSDAKIQPNNALIETPNTYIFAMP